MCLKKFLARFVGLTVANVVSAAKIRFAQGWVNRSQNPQFREVLMYCIMKKFVSSIARLNPAGSLSAVKIQSLLLTLTLMVAAFWVSSAVAAEKETVFDPATGRTWTAPQYGGTLTWAARHHPPVIDPWFSAGWAPHFIGGVNEGLAFADWAISRDIWIGGNHRVWTPEMHRGALAESWSMPDNTTFIWNIRQGVHWDDKAPVNGRELDAYDVEWNYHRYLGLGDFAEAGPSPQAGSFISLSASQVEHLVESITATDKWTVVVKLKKPVLDPFAKFLGNDFFVLAREVIEQYGDAKDWRNVVGTGPLRMTGWVEGSSASWEKNPNYWGVDEKFGNRIPYIDKYISLLMPDISTRLASLRTGKIDMLSHLGDAYIHSIDNIESLKKTNPELEFWPFFGTAAGAFLFNQSMPLTQDVNVRKAFQMAVDRETMATAYFKGYADPAPYGMVGQFNEPGWYWPYEEWPEELKQEYNYNPERAEELLDAAGYPRGADGYRFKIKINVFNRFEPTHGEVLMGYFDAIGIETTDLDILTPAEMGPLVGNPDTHEWALSAGYYGYYASSGLFFWLWGLYNQAPPGVANHWGSTANAKDSRMDALYVAARDTTDLEEFKSLWKQADEIMVREHWGLVKSRSPMFYVSQPWVQGFFGESMMGKGERNTHLARIWIDSEMKKEMGH